MSSKSKHMDLFSDAGCLSEVAIGAYIDGTLTAFQKATVSRHLEECELCNDAIEGATHFKSSGSFHKRIEQMHQSTWRRSLIFRDKSRRLYYGLSSVAASLILLFGLFFLFRVDKLFEQEGKVSSNAEIALTEDVYDSIRQSKANDFVAPENESTLDIKQKPDKKIPDQSKTTYKASLQMQKEKLPEPIIDVEEDLVADELYDYEEELSPKPSSSSKNLKEESQVRSEETKLITTAQGSAADISEKTDESEPSAELHDLSPKEDFKGEVYRQETSRMASQSKSFVVAEVMPMFQGGDVDNFNTYLTDSLIHILPETVWKNTILVSFTIESDGEIKKVKIISGTGDRKMDKQIVELIKTSPTWTPALYNGNPVAVERQVELVLDTLKRSVQ